jgi:hypothetical protein
MHARNRYSKQQTPLPESGCFVLQSCAFVGASFAQTLGVKMQVPPADRHAGVVVEKCDGEQKTKVVPSPSDIQNQRIE